MAHHGMIQNISDFDVVVQRDSDVLGIENGVRGMNPTWYGNYDSVDSE
jgi:hypothetical protein